MKWKQRGAALLLALAFTLTAGQGAALAAGDEDTASAAESISLSVEAIMEAGVEDRNFAQAIYDAIQKQPNAFLDGNTLENNSFASVEELLNSFTGGIDAAGTDKSNDEKIRSIEGIKLLKSADSLDLTDNLVEDLTPLAVSDKKYYGTENNNFNLNLYNNPIQYYTEYLGGRIDITPNLSHYIIPVLHITALHINSGEAGFYAECEVPINVYRDGERVSLEAGQTLLEQPSYDDYPAPHDIASGAEFVEGSAVDGSVEHFYITGIQNTGNFEIMYGGDGDGDNSGGNGSITYESVSGRGDRPTPNLTTPKWYQVVFTNIYSKVEKDDLKTTHTATLAKYGEDDNELKPGAVYSLYQQLGETPDPAADTPLQAGLTTGQDGTVSVAGLASGSYYFLETAAPDGYVLDEAPVPFTLEDGTLAITGGSGNTLTPMGGQTVTIDGTFMLSGDTADAVGLEVTPPDGGQLSSLTLTWTDGNHGGTAGTMEYVVGSGTDSDTQTYLPTLDEAVSAAEQKIAQCRDLYQNVTVSASFSQQVQVEHTDLPVPPAGDLTVSKTVTGDGADLAKEFTFTVTLDDTSVNGTFGEMEFTNGVATFQLAHGESVTATGLPAGAGYTVTESGNDGYTVTSTGETGTIQADQTAEAAFTNAKEEEPTPPEPEEKTGGLTVTKTVTGDGADTTKEFTFTVTLDDTSVNGTFGEMTFANGVATFQLAHGQSVTAAGLPAGVNYTVTESGNDGYTVTATGDTGTIQADQTAEAAFTNAKEEEEPTPPPTDPGDSDDTTSITVEKRWKLDDGGTAAEKVTVALLRNGQQYKTVELSAANNWRHTWSGLEERYNWSVEELDVPDGFTVTTDRKGSVITITNDDQPAPEQPEEPNEPEQPTDPEEPSDPGTPSEPAGPEGPGESEDPGHTGSLGPERPSQPDEPGLPQTGQPWLPVLLLMVGGAGLVLAGVLCKKPYHGKREA